MTTTIILIGPMCAGKSTLALLLAQRLGLPRYELDELRWAYYEEAGFDHALAKQINESEAGTLGILRYSKPFEAYAVERVLADYNTGVIDFGAGHSVYEDEQLFARVEQALAPYPHVILILPLADLDESVAILNARFKELLLREVGMVDEGFFGVNEHFVKHPSNHRLAKLVVYTNGKTPEETCVEIVQRLGLG